MTYTKLTKSQFDEMQFNAGVLLRNFDPSVPSIQDADIICATSGGITLNATPRIEDTGKNIYMMPPNTAEMMKIRGWVVEVKFSAIGTNTELWSVGNSQLKRNLDLTPSGVVIDIPRIGVLI